MKKKHLDYLIYIRQQSNNYTVQNRYKKIFVTGSSATLWGWPNYTARMGGTYSVLERLDVFL